MSTIIEGVELDASNVEFYQAVEFVKSTDRLIYLTGKAGTGKTTFLKYLRTITTINTAIIAPTGVAAINAGGQTIHSFFQIRPSIYVPNDKRLRTTAPIGDTDRSTIFDHFQYGGEKRKILRGLELLIIDEVSMLRCDLLDLIDKLLRVFGRNPNRPFGGVQVILIGDTFQLPPVARTEELNVMRSFYKTQFFFSSRVIEQNKPIYIELKKIYRQKEQEFIELLNKIRTNQISSTEINLLNTKFNPTFTSEKNANYITLTTHNQLADGMNLTKLDELSTTLHSFNAIVTGTFDDKEMPTDRTLQLKEGAQIMFIKNDPSKRYLNGKISKILSIDGSNIFVNLDGEPLKVEKHVWKNIRYTWNEKLQRIQEEEIGTFTQFPIRLAWAITVHKSQGLTFEKVIADLGAAFASGQVYVALSRCTSSSGLVLKTRIGREAIKIDPDVIKFAQNETPQTLIVQELTAGKADILYKTARENFKKLDLFAAYENFVHATKFRNDIETDLFKRYFIVTATRMISYASRFADFQIQLKHAEIDGLELQNRFEGLKKKNAKKKSKIELYRTNFDAMSTEIDSLRYRFIELSKQKVQLQNQVNELKIIQEKLQGVIKEYTFEVDRLRNLKWYHKLFGQK